MRELDAESDAELDAGSGQLGGQLGGLHDARRRRVDGDAATPWLFQCDRYYHWFGASQWWLWVRWKGYGLRRRRGDHPAQWAD